MRDRGEVVGLAPASGPAALVRANGLRDAFVGERLVLDDGTPAVVLDLEERALVAAVLAPSQVAPGSGLARTGRPLELPPPDALLGRALTPLGEPLDSRHPIDPRDPRGRCTLARPGAWPGFADRRPLLPTDALHTGALSVDAFVGLPRGCSCALVGPRRAADTLVDAVVTAQRGQAVRVVLVTIGESADHLLDRLDRLRSAGALDHTVVVAATASDPPALRGLATDAGLALGAEWARSGADALVMWDASRALDAHHEVARHRWPRASHPELSLEAASEQARRLDRAARLELGSCTQLVLVDPGDPRRAETCSRVDRVVRLGPGATPTIALDAPTHRAPVTAVARAVHRAAAWAHLADHLARLVLDLDRLERSGPDLDDRDRAWLAACRRLRGALEEAPLAPRSFEEQVLLLSAFATGAIAHVDPGQVRAFGAALAAHVRATEPALFAAVRSMPREDQPALAACIAAFARTWRPG